MKQGLIWAALAGGVVLDLFTLVLALRANKRGHGPSGVPVLPFALYVVSVALMACPIAWKGGVLGLLTIFHVACQWGIPMGHRQYYNGRTVLHRAVKSGNLHKLEHAIARANDVNVADNAGASALHVAAEAGDLKAVAILLKHEADPNKQDRNGATPLHRAAWRGREDVVRLLMENGADANLKTITGASPSSVAASQGYTALVETIRSYGRS